MRYGRRKKYRSSCRKSLLSRGLLFCILPLFRNYWENKQPLFERYFSGLT